MAKGRAGGAEGEAAAQSRLVFQPFFLLCMCVFYADLILMTTSVAKKGNKISDSNKEVE